jgi:hypothetical protein
MSKVVMKIAYVQGRRLSNPHVAHIEYDRMRSPR